MSCIVAKFGGSSVADGVQIKKVKQIIEDDPKRRYIVVSAPGKSYENNTKVTDLLLLFDDLYRNHQDYSGVLKNIKKIYRNIGEAFGVDPDLDGEFEKILRQMDMGAGKDYVVSRGEYLNAKLIAKILDYEFVDAAELMLFETDGRFDEALSRGIIKRKLSLIPRAVIPGFYGALPDGTIKTFTRGGSDFTGAVVAGAVDAEKYENWTDVSGFLVADPRIVSDPEGIREITYEELRELSYMGASVLHDEAMFPVVDQGIPIEIKNTDRPEDPGTVIKPEERLKHRSNITGIAGRTNFTVIYIQKVKLNQDLSFYRKLMTILETHDIYLEHMPSSIDSVSLIVKDDLKEPVVKDVIEDIKKICKPDAIGYEKGISLITVVGHGMKNTTGTSAICFNALAEADINIRLIVQGSSELNIIIGVDDENYKEAIRAIYYAFLGK